MGHLWLFMSFKRSNNPLQYVREKKKRHSSVFVSFTYSGEFYKMSCACTTVWAACGEFWACTCNIICKIARLVKQKNTSAFLVHGHTLWIVERLKRHKTNTPSVFQENDNVFLTSSIFTIEYIRNFLFKCVQRKSRTLYLQLPFFIAM